MDRSDFLSLRLAYREVSKKQINKVEKDYLNRD